MWLYGGGVVLNPTQMVSLQGEDTKSCLGLKARRPRQSAELSIAGALRKLARGRKDLPAPSPLASPLQRADWQPFPILGSVVPQKL